MFYGFGAGAAAVYNILTGTAVSTYPVTISVAFYSFCICIGKTAAYSRLFPAFIFIAVDHIACSTAAPFPAEADPLGNRLGDSQCYSGQRSGSCDAGGKIGAKHLSVACVCKSSYCIRVYFSGSNREGA